MQSRQRITSAITRELDHVIVVVPRRVPANAWTRIPGLKHLEPAFRRHAGNHRRPLHGTLASGTGVTLSALPAADAAGGSGSLPAPFPLLQFAGEIAADSLVDEPRSLGVIIHGLASGDAESVIKALLLALGARAWQQPSFRSKQHPPSLKLIRILGHAAPMDLERTMAEIDAANLVRWLTALPANKLSAAGYRAVLASLAESHDWTLEWFGDSELKKLNAGAFLAVAQGNGSRDAGIARLRRRLGRQQRHRQHEDDRPDVALVGKGIIFDTGGTNLKSAQHMIDMHTDMSGSAVALATLAALTRLESPLAVDCWLAISENRTGPAAYKQRDVVTACNGVTIEVMHTDAEGRMVLADTLALADRQNPRLMLDYGTLTGACVHALSERYSGVFTNHEVFNELLVRAGRLSGERVWPFPNDPDFDDDIKSKAADVAQCALTGEADQILAFRFLQRFVAKTTPWIHLDLASAWRKDGLAQMPGGATGFGLRYTLALLLDHLPELKKLAG